MELTIIWAGTLIFISKTLPGFQSLYKMLLMICLWCVRIYKHIESIPHTSLISIFHVVFTAALRVWSYCNLAI